MVADDEEQFQVFCVPQDKRKIVLDDKLATLFTPPINIFSMNKQLSKHVFAAGTWLLYLLQIYGPSRMCHCLQQVHRHAFAVGRCQCRRRRECQGVKSSRQTRT